MNVIRNIFLSVAVVFLFLTFLGSAEMKLILVGCSVASALISIAAKEHQ